MICKDENKAMAVIDQELKELEKIIGKAIYGYGDQYLQEVIGELLIKNKADLSLAESCTGGRISGLITSVPGSSAYFKGGIVAYSDEIKKGQLNVPEKTIFEHGAVSKAVVEYMAKGVKEKFNTRYAAAVSGIAGPSGGTDEKPVGTTWIAVTDDEKVISKQYRFGNRRDVNIRLSASKTLDMLRKLILGYYNE
jgi:nicotinamide-nucleotide amidase